MLEGADIPQSPAWWFKVLATELANRRQGRSGRDRWLRTARKPTRVRPPLDTLHDHFRGDPPLRGVAASWADTFREVTRLGRLNVGELIVTAKTDRMGIAGYRTSETTDDLGDKLAHELMIEADLAVKFGEIHDCMGWAGDGYAMALPPLPGEKFPTITDEDPREVISAHDPATGRMLAALKLYRDDWDAADFGQLFIAEDDGSVTHRTAIKRKGVSVVGTLTQFRLSEGWEWTTVEYRDGTTGVDVGRLDRMPVVRFKGRRGVGLFEWHLDTLDRINDQILDKLIIAKVQAFRQMAVKGLPDVERRLVTGPDGTQRMQEVEIDYEGAFVAEPGSLWQVPEGVEFWESGVTDLRPLLESIKDDLEHLAAATKTPLHIITPDAAQGSAEGADLMRESNIDSVRSMRRHAEGSHRDLIATAFSFMEGNEYQKRAVRSGIELVWEPIRSFSLNEMGDTASKAVTSLPREAIQRYVWQMSPTELGEIRKMESRDMLLRAIPPAPPGPGGLAPTFQPPRPPGAPAAPQPPAAQPEPPTAP